MPLSANRADPYREAMALPTAPSLPGRLPRLPRFRLPRFAPPMLPPLRLTLRRDRRIASGGGRVHLELRDLTLGELADVTRVVEPAVRALPGVRWAEVHGPTHRLVVSCGPEVRPADLAAVVEGAERDLGLHHRPFLRHPDHPADVEPLSLDLVGLGADLVGIVLGAAAQVSPVRPPPVEIDLAALLNVADQVLPVRRTIEDRIGVPATDLFVSFTNAVLQGLTQGPLSPMVDLAHRVQLFRELQARRDAWLAREAELFREPPASGTAVPRELRPVPLPDGPVERYTAMALLASLVGGAASLLWSRQPERAVSVVQAGLPKAARMGREGFASQLGQHLAAKGVLVFEPEALRLLDRLDVLVVDAAVVTPGRLDADQLGAAAKKAGIRLFVTGATHQDLPSEVEVLADQEPIDAIQSLQREGHVVGLAVTRPDRAIAAADVVVGLHLPGQPVPWGAHLVACDDGLPVFLLVEAAAEARRVSRESGQVATLGAAAAGVIALGAFSPARSARGPSATNVAAALALVNGVRHAYDLVRVPPPIRADPTPWHALDTAAVLDRLGTSLDGLDSAAAEARLVPETSAPALPVAFAQALAGELVNPLTPVLAAGAALSALVGSMTDAGLVLSVVAANAAVGAVQQLRADHAVAALSKTHDVDVATIRGGDVLAVHPRRLVQGDLIRLEAGQVVPADARLLRAEALEVDESSLTGESLPVCKGAGACRAVAVAERTSMLYEGTWIAAGTALAVVTATGADTEARRALRLAGEPPVSGVEHRLRGWTARMVPLSLGGGALVVLAGIVRRRPLRDTVGSAVSLTVAAVPEGLPLLATVAQLASARRLARHHVLVRNSRAIEALGRADVLCADKTGTLTEGRIALQVVSDGVDEAVVADLPDHLRAVLKAAVRATPQGRDGEDLPHPTDRAVVEGSERNGLEVAWEPLAVLPFEPRRGYHATLGATSRGLRIEVKGAPEVVLPRCSRWQRATGVTHLTGDDRARLDEVVVGLARRGLRVLAVAEGHLPEGRDLDDRAVHRLKLLGFVGLADPARTTSAEAVAMLGRAGVAVMMLTGDHPSTAEGIGHELGLLNGSPVITGAEIDALGDDALGELAERTTVFARVTPAHKVRLVRALQQRGHVVAMTGDGANDAPAIRLADVGIALGPRSTPAAKSAADLLVLDERIETVVEALVEGRGLWASVRDAVAVLVGGNLGEIIFTVGASLLSGTPPLNARQLLLVNLLTDAAPALAIATRPPPGATPEELLREGPDVSLGAALDRAIAWRAGTTAAAAGVAWLAGSLTGPPARARTIALVTLTGTQLGQTIATGGPDPLVLVAGLGSTAILAGIVQTPVLSQLFGCTPLDPAAWAIASTAALGGTVASVVLPRLV
jgi:cation-transporting P-type ATPase I